MNGRQRGLFDRFRVDDSNIICHPLKPQTIILVTVPLRSRRRIINPCTTPDELNRTNSTRKGSFCLGDIVRQLTSTNEKDFFPLLALRLFVSTRT